MTDTSSRLHSVDVFRAITMFLMIFVNELSGAKLIPGWLDHAEAGADALGFADTIFPAFLFIVGLSIPFAISNKQQKSASATGVLTYIGYRSFALLVMGFYQVNLETYNENHWLPKAAWAFLATIAFFMIWLNYKSTVAKGERYGMIGGGYAILLVLALVYKGSYNNIDGYNGMQPQWWGILGIIGWSYLVASLLYWLSKGNVKIMALCLALLMAINIVLHTGVSGFSFWIINDASSVCLVMAGVVTSLAYSACRPAVHKFILGAALSGLLCIAIGLWLRPYAGGISKIYSTPAWVLITAGISLLVYALLVYGTDVKDKSHWFRWIAAAGTSTLTCYLIPYFQVFGMQLLHIHYPHSWLNGAPAILRALAVSFVIILLVDQMQKWRLTLKV
jgi:heparan-alpha-glucosaminide N-acetyltransferase